jgi:hypothetical protein
MRDLIPLRRHNLLFFPPLSRVKNIEGRKKRSFSGLFAIPHFRAAVKVPVSFQPEATSPMNRKKALKNSASAGWGENFNEGGDQQAGPRIFP